jgi:hypothetical protein
VAAGGQKDARREWDGPAATPIPQNALGMGARRMSIPMPRTTTIHPVTAIGIDMGKTTLHMIGLDLHGAIVLREKVIISTITGFAGKSRLRPVICLKNRGR